jgi:hypothetical protein
MISSEVQRTLVKSPPELWTELSDPASLRRHLGEFGEIRITGVEPEKTVEWEAENASGTVLIKPSGWGTRVTLTATREIPVPETPPAPEATVEASPAPEAIAEPQSPLAALPEVPLAAETSVDGEASEGASQKGADAEECRPPEAEFDSQPEPQAGLAPEAQGELGPGAADCEETELAHEPEPKPDPEPEARRGFLARLFRRRRVEQPIEPPSPPAAAISEPTQAVGPASEPPEAAAEQAEESGEQSESLKAPSDISAELKAAEEISTDEVTAVLTSMLDRLGTAHHRPFSRS